jgi:hypothetical protein
MEHFFNILQKIATAKGTVVLIVAAFLAFFVYKNFDFMTEITFKIDRPKSTTEVQHAKESNSKKSTSKKNTTTNYFLFADVQVTPSAFNIPSYIYAEVRNAGSDLVREVEIVIDLGKAQAEQADIKPSDKCSFSQNVKGESIVRVKCSEVTANESIYFYALTSMPIFQKIIVSSSGSVSPIQYSWSNILEKKESSSLLSPGTIGFLWFLVCAVIFVFSVYFIIVAIVFMNKKFKL